MCHCIYFNTRCVTLKRVLALSYRADFWQNLVAFTENFGLLSSVVELPSHTRIVASSSLAVGTMCSIQCLHPSYVSTNSSYVFGAWSYVAGSFSAAIDPTPASFSPDLFDYRFFSRKFFWHILEFYASCCTVGWIYYRCVYLSL